MDGEHRFAEGAPEDLAMSGAIGRAFDGEGFRFDARSGTFRSIEVGKPYAIELLGPDGASRDWVRRLAERLGLDISAGPRDGLETIASITIEESEGGPLFEISEPGSASPGSSAASYGELASVLAKIVADRRE